MFIEEDRQKRDFFDTEKHFFAIIEAYDGEITSSADNDGVIQGMCFCPAHNDKKQRSLAVAYKPNSGKSQKVYVDCKAECLFNEVTDILYSAGLWASSSKRQFEEDQKSAADKIWSQSAEVDPKQALEYFRARGVEDFELPESVRYIEKSVTTVKLEELQRNDDLTQYLEVGVDGKVTDLLADEKLAAKHKHKVFHLTVPAVVCRVDNKDDGLIAVQRIFIDEAEYKKLGLVANKKLNGSPKGGHVKVRENQDTTLHVCEGVETAAAIASKLPTSRVYALLTVSNLERFEVPLGVTELYVWADKDVGKAGQNASIKLATAAIKKGVKVFLMEPPSEIAEGSKSIDWLDEIDNIKESFDQAKPFKPEPWTGAPVPWNYRIDAKKGVRKILKGKKDKDGNVGEPVEIEVTTAPVWYEKCEIDLDTNQSRVTVGYMTAAKNCSRVNYVAVNRTDFGTQAGTSAFRGCGRFPARLANERAVQEYIIDADLDGSNIETELVTTQPGWKMHKGKHILARYPESGLNVIGGSDGDDETLNAYTQKGKQQEWREMVFPVLDKCPLASIPFAGALAAPLLRHLSSPSFVIDISGVTSKGKTTTLKTILSLYANPEGVIRSWSGSDVGTQAAAVCNNDMPMGFDELHSIKKEEKAKVANTVYMLANGVGKGVGVKSGHQRKLKRWKTVLISTGEDSVLTFGDERLGGIDARVIPVNGDILAPIGDTLRSTEQRALELGEFVTNNYGHDGKAYVDALAVYLNNTPSAIEILNKRRADLAKQLKDFVPEGDTVQLRKANAYATLLLGLKLYAELVVDDPRIHSASRHLVTHWKDICGKHAEAIPAHQALDALIEEYYRSLQMFQLNINGSKGCVVKEGMYAGNICFYLKEFRRVLEDGKVKFSSENILREFVNRGFIHPSKTGYTRRVRFPDPHTGKDCTPQLIMLSQKAMELYRRRYCEKVTWSSEEFLLHYELENICIDRDETFDDMLDVFKMQNHRTRLDDARFATLNRQQVKIDSCRLLA